jgi:hypothetical protein
MPPIWIEVALNRPWGRERQTDARPGDASRQ